MNGLTYLLLLAALSWFLRAGFIVLLPGRLPPRVRAALEHTAPAVLAALVSVETFGAVQDDGAQVRLVVVGSLIAVAVVATRRPNPALTTGMGLGAAVLVDLVLAR